MGRRRERGVPAALPLPLPLPLPLLLPRPSTPSGVRGDERAEEELERGKRGRGGGVHRPAVEPDARLAGRRGRAEPAPVDDDDGVPVVAAVVPPLVAPTPLLPLCPFTPPTAGERATAAARTTPTPPPAEIVPWLPAPPPVASEAGVVVEGPGLCLLLTPPRIHAPEDESESAPSAFTLSPNGGSETDLSLPVTAAVSLTTGVDVGVDLTVGGLIPEGGAEEGCAAAGGDAANKAAAAGRGKDNGEEAERFSTAPVTRGGDDTVVLATINPALAAATGCELVPPDFTVDVAYGWVALVIC